MTEYICPECNGKYYSAVSTNPDGCPYCSFEVGEIIIVTSHNKYELGKIKSLKPNGAFVQFHSGSTAAGCKYEVMHKIDNAWLIKDTLFGTC